MSSQKRFLCEAKTSGAVEAAAIVVRCDDRDDAREIALDTFGVGLMGLKIREILDHEAMAVMTYDTTVDVSEFVGNRPISVCSGGVIS